MKVTISKGKVSGEVIAPPSKSFAHRQLICSALSGKKCTVKGIVDSEDMLATLDCLKALGYTYRKTENQVEFLGERVDSTSVFNCRESGSTLRFMLPVSLCFCDDATFLGSEKLISRGIGIYQQIFGEKGVKLTVGKDCVKTHGRLKSGDYKIMGNLSSQFVTGMFFALPLLRGDSTVEILPPIESKSYINITLRVLKTFGINIVESSPNLYEIKGGQTYKNIDSVVEGDWSNAAFLFALKELGGELLIKGLNHNSEQGDKVCVQLLSKIKSKTLDKIDLSDCPDLAPVLFAFAAVNGGATFVGTKRLKIKESDRATAMQTELKKFGVEVEVKENEVTVFEGKIQTPAQTLYGHNDHRIVMSLAILCTITGGQIEGAEAIKKSYPSFFKVLSDLNIKVEYEY